MFAIALTSVPRDYVLAKSNYLGWVLIIIAVILAITVWPISGPYLVGVFPLTLSLALSGFWIAELGELSNTKSWRNTRR